MELKLYDSSFQSVFIDICRACNLRCVMCDIHSEYATADYAASKTTRDSKLMDFELFKMVIDQAAPLVKTYIPQGAGEPLMHPRFTDMLAYIRYKVPDANIWFNTNGQLLTPEVTDRLLAIGVNLISFSIDAASSEVYSDIRVGGDYKQLLRNIRYLVKAKKRSAVKIKPEVDVSFVLQERNRSEKRKFLKYWLPKVRQVVFFSKLELDRTTPNLFFNTAQARTSCESLWSTFKVSLDGVIAPCCCDVALKEPLGSIYESNLQDILVHGRHLELRKMHLSGNYTGSSLCATCKTWMTANARSYSPISKKLSVIRNPFSEAWSLNR